MICNPVEREVEICWLALTELRFKETRTISLLPGPRVALVSGNANGAVIVGTYTNRITLAELRNDVEFVLWQRK